MIFPKTKTMSATRNGKIARLPRSVRNQLDLHLDNGMEAEPILEWVNALPETQAVLLKKFDGKPINPQNLTEWRQGGHQDWLRNQQRLELARHMAEHAQDLDAPEQGPRLTSDQLGLVLTVELAAMVKEWQAGAGEPKERWEQLRALLRELAVLRREDHRAQREKIAQEKWAWQAEALEEEKQRKIEGARIREANALYKKLSCEITARGYRGSELMQMGSEVHRAVYKGKPMPQWAQEFLAREESAGPESLPSAPSVPSGSPCPAPSSRSEAPAALPRDQQPNQAQSNPIKPDQTERVMERPSGNDETRIPKTQESLEPFPFVSSVPSVPFDQPQSDAPDQAGSNPIKPKMCEAFPDANALGSAAVSERPAQARCE